MILQIWVHCLAPYLRTIAPRKKLICLHFLASLCGQNILNILVSYSHNSHVINSVHVNNTYDPGMHLHIL